MKFLSDTNLDSVIKVLNKLYKTKFENEKKKIKNIFYYVETKYSKYDIKQKNYLVINILKKIYENTQTNILSFGAYDQSTVKTLEPSEFEKSLREELDLKLENSIPEEFYRIHRTEEEDYGLKQIFVKDDAEALNKDDITGIENYFGNESLFLEPPEDLKKLYDSLTGLKFMKKYTILVDSRDRNHDVYDVNKYTIHLNSIYHNVFCINLKYITLPNSDYIINSSNNVLDFEETNDEIITLTLPEGNYTKNELMTELQNQLNTLGSSNYTVSNSTHSLVNKYHEEPSRLITSNEGDAWKVFDNNYNSHWESETNVNTLTYRLPRTSTITRYIINVSSLAKGYPTDWTLESSNDGINWTIIDTQVAQVYPTFVDKEYLIPGNQTSGRFLRMNITDTSNSTDMNITELKFFKTDTTNISISSDLTGGDNIFNLYFTDESSIKGVLGYELDTYTSTNEYITENDFNLNDYENYVYLYLNSYGQLSTVENNQRKDIYTKILLDGAKNDYVTFKPDKTETASYVPEWPITIDKLEVEFKRYDRSLYNFNGKEHSFLVEFLTLTTNYADVI